MQEVPVLASLCTLLIYCLPALGSVFLLWCLLFHENGHTTGIGRIYLD